MSGLSLDRTPFERAARSRPKNSQALSPNLMGAANSSGGVMRKLIEEQRIVVASTARRWFNHEGDILRHLLFHLNALACLVGALVGDCTPPG